MSRKSARGRKPTSKLCEAVESKHSGLRLLSVAIHEAEKSLADHALQRETARRSLSAEPTPRGRPQRSRKRVNYCEDRAASTDSRPTRSPPLRKKRSRQTSQSQVSGATSYLKPDEPPQHSFPDNPPSQTEFLATLKLQPQRFKNDLEKFQRLQLAGLLVINSSHSRGQANDFLARHPDITILVERDLGTNLEAILVEKGILKQELKIHPRLYFSRLIGPPTDPRTQTEDVATDHLHNGYEVEAEKIKRKIDLETSVLRAARASLSSRMVERRQVVSTLHKLRNELSSLTQDLASGERQLTDLRGRRVKQRCQLDEEWKLTDMLSEKFNSLLKKKEALLNRYLQEIHDVDARIGQEDERITTFIEVEERQKDVLRGASEKMENMRKHREQLEQIQLKQQDQLQHQRGRLSRLNEQISDMDDQLKNHERIITTGEGLLQKYNQSLSILQRLVVQKEELFDCYERSLECLTHQTNLTMASLNNEGTNLASVTQSGIGLRQIANILFSLNNERNLLVRHLSRERDHVPQAAGINISLSPFPFCQVHRHLVDKPCPTQECSIPTQEEAARNALIPDHLQGCTNQFHHQPLAFLPQQQQFEIEPVPLNTYTGPEVARPLWPADFPRPAAEDSSRISGSNNNVVVESQPLPPGEGQPPEEFLASEAPTPRSITRSVSHSRSVTRSPCEEDESCPASPEPRDSPPEVGRNIEVTTSTSPSTQTA